MKDHALCAMLNQMTRPVMSATCISGTACVRLHSHIHTASLADLGVFCNACLQRLCWRQKQPSAGGLIDGQEWLQHSSA
jgi:hypothetical protein